MIARIKTEYRELCRKIDVCGALMEYCILTDGFAREIGREIRNYAAIVRRDIRNRRVARADNRARKNCVRARRGAPKVTTVNVWTNPAPNCPLVESK